LFCKKCGIAFPDNLTNCPRCGAAPLKGAPDVKIFKPEPAKSFSAAKIFTLLILLIIIGSTAFLLLPGIKPGNKPETDATEQNIPEAAEDAINPDIAEGSDAETIMRTDTLPDSHSDSLNREGIGYLKRGEYHKARESFETALRGAPSNIALKENLAITLTMIAWQEVSAGNYAASMQLFQEALDYNPLLHNARRGIGLVLLKQEEPLKASPYIDAYIENVPSDSGNKELLLFLAGAFLKSGVRDKAAEYLEKLLEVDPENNAARRRLAMLRKEEHVESDFQKKEGSHFIVKFEGGENSDIGHLISIILEEAYIKVGADMGYYPEDKIEAALYTQQQFTDVTRAPAWAGAIYDGRIKIPAGGITNRTNLLERVLFHEYAHALVHRLSKGRAPVWLNEGIAQHVEGAVNENINEVLSFVAKSEKPLSLRVFEGSFMGFNAPQALVAYSVSLSAAEYIINEFGMSAIKRILENIGQGKTLEQAISSSIYISYEDLQKNWLMAVKRKFAG